MNDSVQETPYQLAFRARPPIANGTWIEFRCPVYTRDGLAEEQRGNLSSGEVIGHRATFDNNVFKSWSYIVVPVGLRLHGHILFTTEIPESHLICKNT